MKKYIGKCKSFTLFWIHTTAILFIANKLMPEVFVLGNFKFSVIAAAIATGLFITIVLEIVSLLMARYKEIKITEMQRPFFFLLVNFLAFWLAARWSAFLGFGVVKFTWLIILAVILTLIQTVISKSFKK